MPLLFKCELAKYFFSPYISVTKKVNVIVLVTNHCTHAIYICLSWERKESLGYSITLKYFPAVAEILWFFTIIETQQEMCEKICQN